MPFVGPAPARLDDMKRWPILLLGALFSVVPWHGSAWAQG